MFKIASMNHVEQLAPEVAVAAAANVNVGQILLRE
jgi:hypothetical protein